MKRFLVVGAVLLIAVGAFAQNVPELNEHAHHFPVKGWARPGGGGSQNLSYHGGPVLQQAHVVMIFWGSFPAGYTTDLQNFRNQFGMSPEFNVITQYSNIRLTNLAAGPLDYFDTSNPPTNVTDAIVQGEVNKYLGLNPSTNWDASAIYEVFIPSTSYSSDGTGTSCGGPSLGYCAYHGHFTNSVNGADTKYSIQPWAGCSGCSSFNNTTLDQEHFVCHETREAVTDEDLNAWYDRAGNEADDKCAWSPAPFIGTGGFGYQYEWSNANGGCVKTR